MKNLLLVSLTLFLFSCGSVSLSNGQQKVIIKTQQPPCDIHRKEIDPNCKVEGKTYYLKEALKFGNPNAA